MPIELTDSTFDEFVQGSDVPVLVDFWAEWCPPCKMMDKTLAHLADEADGKYTVVKVNADTERRLVERYGVQTLPTFFVFDEGEVRGIAHGAQGIGAMRTLIKDAS